MSRFKQIRKAMRTRAATSAKRQRNVNIKHSGIAKMKKKHVKEHVATLESKNTSTMKYEDTTCESYNVFSPDENIVIKEEELIDEKPLSLGISAVEKGEKTQTIILGL
jgi:hypothetical protein